MQSKIKTYLIHSSLFVVTFITTTLSGEYWTNGKMWLQTSDYSWSDFADGMSYSIPFLLILTVHEFGHYFMAKYHRIKTTLPYYIPLPPFLLIGTMGALIRIKEMVKSTKQHFDIGVTGPLAGFVVALVVLFYGFTTLPPKEHIFEIHPEYEVLGMDYEEKAYTYEFLKDVQYQYYLELKSEDSLNVANTGEESKIGEFVFPDEYPMIVLGNSLLFDWCKGLAKDQSRIPHPYEMLHYPWLLAGFFALFFTSLNLLPIGQLDGGHVLYGLIGTRWHRKIARGVFLAFIFYAGLGILTPYDTAETILFNIPLPFAIALYIFFLYTILTSVYKDKVTRLMVALIIFTPQFTLPMLNPDLTGYSGWLVFSFILGRVIGVYHPPVPVETPLDLKRKVIGWIALIIFVISFSPNPVYIETLTP